MDMAKIQKLAIGLGAAWLVYKFGKGEAMKAAALGVVGVIVAKQVPMVSDSLA
jgi:hypothetical protein